MNEFKALRATGYREGEHTIFGRKVSMGIKEMALVRQVDRLLLRVICQNYEGTVKLAGSNDPGDLLEAAWSCFGPARLTDWGEGDYVVGMPGDIEVKYSLSAWDESLLRQYAEMIKRISE